MNKKILFLTLVSTVLLSVGSCKKGMDLTEEQELSLKSVTIPPLNWESTDWMPTPPGQSLISVPWIGQGSISSLYPLDVVNDYKKFDGWELVYNTFDASSPGPLVNPYFMLYNKYRGILRIYLYTTTQFLQSSTYLQDGLNLLTNSTSSILNFLGDDLIDVTTNKLSYSQMQPKPMDGSFPLASNKWYMLEYELAYDPSLANKTSNEILLSWFTNFYDVSEVELSEEQNGSITGTIGSTQPNLFSLLGTVGESTGKISLSAIGVDFMTKNTIDSNTGENKLGLPSEIFKAMDKGFNSALSSASSKLPGNVFNVFSGILSGSTGGGQSVNLKFNSHITLIGEMANHGSFPSSPTSIYIPGTIIPSNAQGYIPGFNKVLGVFNLTERPKVRVSNKTKVERTGNPREGFKYQTYYEKHITPLNNSNKLVINAELLKEANVRLVEEDVIFIRNGGTGTVSKYDGHLESVGDYEEVYTNCSLIKSKGTVRYLPAIRMTIEVTPKTGINPVYIMHTFLADEVII